MATWYLHRRCRRETCSKWSVFGPTDTLTDLCTHCQEPYGKIEVGLDYESTSLSEPKK